MKTIMVYQCEICGDRSEDKAWIERCQAKGRATRVLKRGVAWEHEHHGDHPDGTDGIILVVNKAFVEKHTIGYQLYGFRDTQAGDNGPQEQKSPSTRGYCGADVYGPEFDHRFAMPSKSTPRFRRAKKELAKIGVQIIAFDGTDRCFEAAPKPTKVAR